MEYRSIAELAGMAIAIGAAMLLSHYEIPSEIVEWLTNQVR